FGGRPGYQQRLLPAGEIELHVGPTHRGARSVDHRARDAAGHLRVGGNGQEQSGKQNPTHESHMSLLNPGLRRSSLGNGRIYRGNGESFLTRPATADEKSMPWWGTLQLASRPKGGSVAGISTRFRRRWFRVPAPVRAPHRLGRDHPRYSWSPPGSPASPRSVGRRRAGNRRPRTGSRVSLPVRMDAFVSQSILEPPDDEFPVSSSPALQVMSLNPYSACFWDRVRVMRGLGARSATFCHYNRRRVRIGSAPREASGPDGPSEHAGGASQRSASAGPTLLRIWEY